MSYVRPFIFNHNFNKIYVIIDVGFKFQSVTTILNDNELETKSVIPESNAKCGRHYLFSDEECIIVSTIIYL